MKINPYLGFDGNCREAIEFYQKILKGKITFMMTNADTPMKDQFPADQQNRIMHARLEIGDAVIMAGDAPPGMYQTPHSITISIMIDDNAEAARVFKELTDGGEVHMPFADSFWAEGFGMGRDKFGVPWMVNGKQKPMQ